MHLFVRRWVDAIDGFTAWLIAGGASERTVNQRRSQIARLAATNRHRNPWKVTTDDLTEWLANPDWSPSTRAGYRAAARKFYRWGFDVGRCKRNPAASLPSITIPRYSPRPTPDTIFERALQLATDRDRLILAFGGYAGLRRAEIAASRFDDVTEQGLRVTGKGGHTRVVPIHPLLHAEIDCELERRQSGTFGTGYRYALDRPGTPYVFPGRTRGHMTPECIGRAATKALNAAGWTTHTLRHRFGTKAYAASLDLLATASLMGHANTNTTASYARVASHRLIEIVQHIT